MALSDSEKWEQAAQHRIIKTFRSWDDNGDGTIECAELERVLKELNMNEANIQKIFVSMDKNKDGSISYTEFVTWLFGKAYADLPAEAANVFWYKETIKEALLAVKKCKPFGTPRSSTTDEMKCKTMLLRDQVINVDSADPDDGTTVMIAAAKAANADMVRWLVEQKCKTLNTPDKSGKTPLDWAQFLGATRVVNYMTTDHLKTDGGTAIDADKTPFVRSLLPAVERSEVEAVRQLLFPSITYTAAVTSAQGKLHGLKTRARWKDNFLLQDALEVQEIEAGLLQDWGGQHSKPVKKGDVLLKVEYVKAGQKTETKGDVRDLQQHLDEMSWEPPEGRKAAAAGEPPRVPQGYTLTFARLRPDLTTNPNVRESLEETDVRGAPALMVAIKRGNKEIVDFFLAAEGLDPNLKDRYDRTAFDMSVEKNDNDLKGKLGKLGGKPGIDVAD